VKNETHYGKLELPQGKHLQALSSPGELKALRRLRNLPPPRALYKGTLEGEPCWADGIILGTGPMPKQWARLWEEWQRDFDWKIHPDVSMDTILPREPGSPMVVLGTLSKADSPRGFFSERMVVLIAEDGTPVTLNARYVAFFLKRFGNDIAFEYYPPRETIRPVGIFSGGKRVGFIMPYGGQARGAASPDHVTLISRKWGLLWEHQKDKGIWQRSDSGLSATHGP